MSIREISRALADQVGRAARLSQLANMSATTLPAASVDHASAPRLPA